MWIPSFLHESQWWLVLITLLLTLTNTMGMMLLCFHGNITKMIDLFSGFTFLIICSALRPWHSVWQSQAIITLLMLAVYVYQQIDRHQINSAAEHTFLISLLIGLSSYWLPSLLLLIVPVILSLIWRQSFDGQSFLAILLGLALIAIYATIFCWAGWIEPSWIHFFNSESLPLWYIIVAGIVATIINYICYSGEAIWRGLTFIGYVLLCVAAWITTLVIPLH